MNPNQTATILHFEEIEPGTWAFRYAARGDLFHEIKETIMEADRDDRRWDPELYDGRGAWSLEDGVLYDIAAYFPDLMRLREKRLQERKQGA